MGETGASAVAYSGSFSYTTTTGDGHTLQLNGEFAGIANGNTLIEEFWCAGSATPDAVSTTLSTCTLGGAPATNLGTYPGDVAVGSGVLVTSLANIPPGGLLLCGSGSTSFLEADLGPPALSASACTPSPTAAPQLPDLPTVQADLLAVEGLVASSVTRYSDPCNLPDVNHLCHVVPPN
ncbi:MAG TPA: hypothetical protein VGQ42_02725 [Candidatus Dormibacteraeota bacterium]|nr:hypothetical protein [Candidatus Dormibacteraeota bacterium]